MKRDFSTQLKDMNGKPLFNHNQVKDEDGKPVFWDGTATVKTEKEAVTLQLVALNALSVASQEKVGADEARKRYRLLVKIQKGGHGIVDVSADDISMIKRLVLANYQNPMIFGQVDELLEGPEEKSVGVAVGDQAA